MYLYIKNWGIEKLPSGKYPAPFLREMFPNAKEVIYALCWWKNDKDKPVAPFGWWIVKKKGGD